jgi:hypothetical protein
MLNSELYVPTISVICNEFPSISYFADATLSSSVLHICRRHVWNYAKKLSAFPEYSLYLHHIDVMTLTYKETISE